MLAAGCQHSCDDSSLTTAGLATLVAGAVATPLGWVLFANSRTRLQRIDDGGYGAAEPQTQVRVGVVGLGLGGFGLGAIGKF